MTHQPDRYSNQADGERTSVPSAPEVVSIDPGGWESWVQRLLAGRDKLTLQIRTDGFRHGSMWGVTQHEWANVSWFGIRSVQTATSDGLINFRVLTPTEMDRLVPIWYNHYGLEPLATILNAYKLNAVVADEGTEDSVALKAARDAMSQHGWNVMERMDKVAVFLGMLGLRRPHLVPASIHFQFVQPFIEGGVSSVERLLEYVSAFPANPRVAQAVCGEAIRWVKSNLSHYRPVLERELAITKARNTATPGRFSDRGNGRQTIEGTLVELGSLVGGAVTVGQAIQAMKLPPDQLLVFDDTLDEWRGQGVLWRGPGELYVWLWVDEKDSVSATQRDWRVDQFLDRTVVGVEVTRPGAESSCWRGSSRFDFMRK